MPDLAGAIAAFAQAPDADIWARYPDLSDDETDRTDTVACQAMTARFLELVQATEPSSAVVGSMDGWVDDHHWARVGTINIDWTARQFWSLEYPLNPELADLPCPLIWEGEGHPIVDFDRMRTEPAAPHICSS